MIHSDIIQGSLQWHTLRLGRITSTTAHALMSKARKAGDMSSALKSEFYRIKAERNLTDECKADPSDYLERTAISSAAMEWGKAYENRAREVHAFATDLSASEVGFVTHDQYSDYWGDSVDGLLTDTATGEIVGCLEIKCPKTATFQEYYDRLIVDKEPLKAVEPKYYWQVINHLSVCNFVNFCDFVIFDPMHRKGYAYVRFNRSEVQEDIDALTEAVKEFIGKLD